MKTSQASSLVLLVSLVTTTAALKCFHCTNCGDGVGSPYDCDSDYEVCMKISVAGRVEKSCAQKIACGLGSVERGVVTAWNKIKNLLSDVDEAVSDEVEAKIVKCCDEDYCNSATTTLLNPLVLLPTFFYLIRF